MKKKNAVSIAIVLLILSGIFGIIGKYTGNKETKQANKNKVDKIEEIPNDKVSVKGEYLKTDEKHSWFRFTIKNNTDKTLTGTLYTGYKNEGDEKEKDRINIDINLEPGTHDIKTMQTTKLIRPMWSHKLMGTFQESTAYKSKYYSKEIFKIEGNLTTLFVLVDKIDKDQLNDIIKEYKDKYNKISTIKFFNKNQNVKIGENPYLSDIDEKAVYTIGNDKLTIN